MHGTIVCGVSDPSEGHTPVQLAAALAARLGLRIVLVHVIADLRGVEDDKSEKPPQLSVQRRLEAIAREVGVAAETRVVLGNRADGLAQAAAEEGADMIVLGSRARGVRGRQLRCVLARELEAVTVVPVLIAPPPTRERNGRRLALVEPVAGR
jgi:nucleotide-binding universal stress UspA family protein